MNVKLGPKGHEIAAASLKTEDKQSGRYNYSVPGHRHVGDSTHVAFGLHLRPVRDSSFGLFPPVVAFALLLI